MSAYQFTLENAKSEQRIRDVARNCSTSAEYASVINSVTRMLMKRGNWWQTEVLVRLCVRGCKIVWPNYVGTVTGVRFCCFGQMQIHNGWYSILGAMGSAGAYGAGYTGWGGVGSGGWIAPSMFDLNTMPVHTQITGNAGHYVQYRVVKNTDYGKTIKIFGTQFGGQPLQEKINGVWVNGITLTAVPGTNGAQSSMLITRIDQIVREATEGMTYLYQYDPTAVAGQQLLQLAVYQPNETNPQYRVSAVTGFNQIRGNEDANGAQVWTLDAMVKLSYYPVVNDRDFLFIGDYDALAFGIQALNFDNAQDPQNAETYFTKAIRELNFESRDKNPGSQFTVKARFMGSQTLISNPI